MEVLDLSGGVKVEPLVSIITPSYNSEKYLDAFFISILDRKSTRLNSSHREKSRMPSSA